MKNSPFRLSVLSVSSLLALCACVSTSFISDSYQAINFAVSGPEKAGCYAYAGNARYHFSVPGLVRVKKSGEMLRVTCMSGNRTVDLNIPPAVHETPVWTGSAGVTDGYNTQVLYSYPSAVKVDFGVFSVPAVSSMTLEEAVAGGEPAVVSGVMLPDLPDEGVPAKPAAAAKNEDKGNFTKLLKGLGAKPGRVAAEDGDVVEIPPQDGPVSLTKPQSF